MKFILIVITLTCSLLAQNAYSDKKIDMHGGNHNSLTGNSSGGFRSTSMNMSMFLDKNTSKSMTKQSIQIKK